MQTHNDSEESAMQRDGKDGTVQKFLITMTEKVMGKALNI